MRSGDLGAGDADKVDVDNVVVAVAAAVVIFKLFQAYSILVKPEFSVE